MLWLIPVFLDENLPGSLTTYFAFRNSLTFAVLAWTMALSVISLSDKKGLSALWSSSLGFHLCNFGFGLGVYWISNPVYTGHLLPLRLLPLLLALLSLIMAAGLLARQRKLVHNPWHGPVLGVLGLLFVWCLLEGGFLFVSRSHANNASLASRRWFAQNWRLNDQGFREDAARYAQGGKRVLVLGDSFTAGHGVAEVESFPAVLEKYLCQQNEKVWVHNLGAVGAGPVESLENLRDFPLPGDLILLQWFVNDLDDAFTQVSGTHPPQPDSLNWLVQHSQPLNYLHFSRPDPEVGRAYLDFLQNAFDSEAALQQHFQDLDQILSYAQAKEIPVLVVIFPFLQDYHLLEKGIDHVKYHFVQEGVEVLDVRAMASDWEPAARIVNSGDGHPSPALHAVVGEELGKIIETKPWLR